MYTKDQQEVAFEKALFDSNIGFSSLQKNQTQQW